MKALRERFAAADGVTALSLYFLVLIAVPAPMKFSAMGQVGGPSTLLALLCFLWWAWERVRVGRFDVGGGGKAVRGLALFFLVVVCLTYAHSAGLPIPSTERTSADSALIRLTGLVGVVCVAADGVPTLERLWVLVRRMTMVVGALTMLVLLQIVTGEVWVDRISIPGLSAPEGLALIQRGMLLRPSGTATHPIELAALLAMTMPLVFAVAWRETRHPLIFRAVALAVPLVILLNGSRTALVCGVVAFLVMLAAWPPRVRILASASVLMMLLGLAVAMPGFLRTVTGLFAGASDDPSVTSRTESYGKVVEFWSHHPWLGRGIGTFLPEYWILDNEYLNLLIGGGVLTVGALVLLLGVCVVTAFAASRRAPQGPERQLAAAVAAGVLAGAVSCALFDTFAFPQAASTLFLLGGLSSAVSRLIGPAEVDRGRADPSPAGWGTRTAGDRR